MKGLMQNITEKTLELVEKIKGQQTVEKAYTTATGLNWYDLEPAAKLLFPVITPLRNELPRVPANGGNATNWKALTGINTSNQASGVSEGNRGAVISVTEQDFTAPYRGLGLEDYETFEAEYGSKNFDDLRALMTQGLLWSVMMKEEQTIIGGNGSDGIALGTPATPSLSKVGGSGTLGAITLSVIVVALTLDGLNRAVVGANGVATQFTKTNADGSTDTVNGGSSNKSAAQTLALSAGDIVTATVTAIKGAYGYAWYIGTAGSEKIVAITTVNKAVFSALPAGGNQAATSVTADNSKNSLDFSGIWTQAFSGSAYFASLDGGFLTTDGAAGIVELDTALKSMWDNYRVSPDRFLINSQEAMNINKKVVAAGGTPLFRFVSDGGGNTLTAGSVIGNYLNKFTMQGGQLVNFMLHPNVPAGTILIYCSKPPYAHSRIRNVAQMKVRKEYYQIDWALRSRKYETGVYCDELAQTYATFCFGAIANIGNG